VLLLLLLPLPLMVVLVVQVEMLLPVVMLLAAILVVAMMILMVMARLLEQAAQICLLLMRVWVAQAWLLGSCLSRQYCPGFAQEFVRSGEQGWWVRYWCWS